MNEYHRAILKRIERTEPARGKTKQRPEHLGTVRRWHGLANAQRRKIMLDFAAENRELSYADWRELVDSLYHGVSYEERCAPQTLLLRYPQYRRVLPLSQLDEWLGCLEGWAEVDSTCQTVFSAVDLLAAWDDWSALLRCLASDTNINKQRAALVLLTAPISQSGDARLLELALELIRQLQSHKDKRITKAISWLLRKGIKQHSAAIAAFVAANAQSLPAIAVRETVRKLATGKK
ncbi:MAG: DNA alkylation repair protein [Chloroflexi bacterium]|nr:DNA alkylation repair protein [Chloroflexota bacterium]MCY4247253.1 DNA alkylation repair protein [Chloroflexota bacterium]